jgi:hypothetical protein
MAGPSVDPTASVSIDAYTGTDAASGRFAGNVKPWALARPSYGEKTQRPGAIDEADWQRPEVGWGVILRERAGLTPAELATAADAPEPIQALVAARGGKVIRYRPGAAFSSWTLRDYAGGGDLLTAGSPEGMGAKQLPKYLLIYGSPRDVPWDIQHFLNPVRHVGRLDLEGVALENYVTALMNGWKDSTSSYTQPVVWAVDHQGGDITTLMRDTVALPLRDALDDGEIGPTFVDGSTASATGAALLDALGACTPSLVITSSHGMTGPLDDLGAMAADLGVLVDQEHQLVSVESILERWQPDGAIWFAQACCSAGATSPSAYADLFEAGTTLEQVLTGVAKVGPMTSPLPRALLGAVRPLRAFVGHVEPTFDWTLSFPPNRQVLTSDLRKCLYQRLCLGQPVGLAMSDYYPSIGTLLLTYLAERQKYESLVGDAAKPSLDMLVYSRVTAHDRASTVILGDPTVAMAVPAGR